MGARTRLGWAIEWVAAAAVLLVAFILGSVVVRELRVASDDPSTDAVTAPRSALPTSVPAGAVSVPVLLLLDGKEVRVGDTASHIAALLGRGAEVGTQQVAQGRLGRRLTRFYEHADTEFILVFEAIERDGEPRVAAIYLH